MSNGENAKEQLLQEVSREFRAAMPARLDELAEFLVQWMRDGDGASGEALLCGLHSIHGAAALFGLDALGDAAGRGERLARRILDGKMPSNVPEWSALHDAINCMRRL